MHICVRLDQVLAGLWMSWCISHWLLSAGMCGSGSRVRCVTCEIYLVDTLPEFRLAGVAEGFLCLPVESLLGYVAAHSRPAGVCVTGSSMSKEAGMLC
jgi:hypothetical protein